MHRADGWVVFFLFWVLPAAMMAAKKMRTIRARRAVDPKA